MLAFHAPFLDSANMRLGEQNFLNLTSHYAMFFRDFRGEPLIPYDVE